MIQCKMLLNNTQDGRKFLSDSGESVGFATIEAGKLERYVGDSFPWLQE